MSHIKDIFENIRKTSAAEIMFILLFAACSICPGVLAIWIFDPILFEKASTLLILLIALSITLPITTLNLLPFTHCAMLTRPKNFQVPPKESLFLIIAAGFAISMFVILIPLIIAFLLSFGLRSFLVLLILTQFLVLAPQLILILADTRKEMNGNK